MQRVLALCVTFVGIALLVQQGYLILNKPQAVAAGVVFADVSRVAGVVNNRVASLDMAVGIAWGDYDNDGRIDLYVTDPAGPNTLYHNNGHGAFTVSSDRPGGAAPGLQRRRDLRRLRQRRLARLAGR